MPDVFTYIWNLENKINKQNRNRLIDREHFDCCQLGGGLGGWVKNVKGLRGTN